MMEHPLRAVAQDLWPRANLVAWAPDGEHRPAADPAAGAGLGLGDLLLQESGGDYMHGSANRAPISPVEQPVEQTNPVDRYPIAYLRIIRMDSVRLPGVQPVYRLRSCRTGSGRSRRLRPQHQQVADAMEIPVIISVCHSIKMVGQFSP
jgi:hypothetical protein